MPTLKEFFSRALREGWALGHFNASELDQMRAIAEACQEAGAPAFIGMSEGERKHLGLNEAVVLRDVLRKEYTVPIFLNADHCKSIESAKEAIEAGFDSVHIDLSGSPLTENISGTKEIVVFAKAKDPEISVEGELGLLRGESKVQDKKIELSPTDYTDPEKALEFAKSTGINRLAIAVGNIHGLSLEEPDLDIKRIEKIRGIIPEDIVLVLHAGSGIQDRQIKAAIVAGIANIHINTDLRVAFKEGLEKSMREQPKETAMYKLDALAIQAMKRVIKEKLELFGSNKRF